jgi:WD40 repeat protein/predicted Ser/Thr protein kinase
MIVCPYCSNNNPDNASNCQVCGASINLASLASGALLHHGNYRIGQVLGQGGFGITYAASQTNLGRKVTIKELFPEGTSRQNTTLRPANQYTAVWPQMVKDFVQEARTVAQFRHPNIVSVSDVFEENNTAYYVMEFLEGQTLEGLRKNGPLPADRAQKMVLDLCQALTVVHGQGLLHRDIKPDNIFIEKSGRVVLIDFGSARLYSGKTVSHTQLLTPGYAPFEQYLSQARFGPPTDIYALGATLFTMLTNQIPPTAPDRVQNAALPWRGNEPAALQAAVEWAMQTDTKQRPQNIAEWTQRLSVRAPVASPPVVPTIVQPVIQPTMVQPVLPPTLRAGVTPGAAKPGVNWGVLVGILVLLGVLGVLVAPQLRSNPKPVATNTVKPPAPKPPAPKPVYQKITTLSGHSETVSSVAYSPDGSRIVTGSWDKTAIIWNASTGAKISTLNGHSDYVRSVAYSADGSRIVTGSDDNTAIIWNASTGAKIATLAGHTDSVYAVAYSPDGSRIVTGSDDNTAIIWNASTGAKISTLAGHTWDVWSVAYSPDGSSIVTGSADKTAIIWNASTGAKISTLNGHSDYVLSVAYSPDGSRIVTGSDDKTAIIWNASTGAKISTLAGHAVSSVAYSPDGSRIVTGSSDGTAIIWNASSGAKITTLSGHTNSVWSVAYSPDGSRIVTGSVDNTAIIWNAR